MSSAFGFTRYPQQKTPPAEAVGMALLQRGQGQPASAAPPMMMGSAPEMGPPPDALLRAQGAERMTGSGQMDDGMPMEDGHSLNAISVAVGEALTRMGGGYATSPNPFKPRERALQNLQQLGLSSVEAQLLIRTGGA